MHTHEEMKQLN